MDTILSLNTGETNWLEPTIFTLLDYYSRKHISNLNSKNNSVMLLMVKMEKESQ